MRFKTRIMAFLLVFMMAVPCVPYVSAAERAYLKVEKVSGVCSPGSEVTIEFSISNLSYADSFVFQINYDPDFMVAKEKGISFSPALIGMPQPNMNNASKGEIRMGYSSMSTMGDGKLFDIKFDIKAQNGKKFSDITLSHISFQYDNIDIDVAPVNGRISLADSDNQDTGIPNDGNNSSNQNNTSTQNNTGNQNNTSGNVNTSNGNSSSTTNSGNSSTSAPPGNGSTTVKSANAKLSEDLKTITSNLKNTGAKAKDTINNLNNAALLADKLIKANLGSEMEVVKKQLAVALAGTLDSAGAAASRLGASSVGKKEYTNLCSLLSASLKLAYSMSDTASAKPLYDSINKLLKASGTVLDKENSDEETILVLSGVSNELLKYSRDKKFAAQEKSLKNELFVIAQNAVKKKGMMSVKAAVKGKTASFSIDKTQLKNISSCTAAMMASIKKLSAILNKIGVKNAFEKNLSFTSGTNKGIEGISSSFSSEAWKVIKSGNANGVAVISPAISVTLPKSAVATANFSNIILEGRKTSLPTNSTKAVKNFVGKNPVYEIAFKVKDSKTTKSLKKMAGAMEVSIPVSKSVGKNVEKILVYHIGTDGKFTRVGGTYNAVKGTIDFKTNLTGTFVLK